MACAHEQIVEFQSALVYSLSSAPDTYRALYAVTMDGHVVVWREMDDNRTGTRQGRKGRQKQIRASQIST